MVKSRLIRTALGLGLLVGVGVIYTLRQNADPSKETAAVVEKIPLEAATAFFTQLEVDGDHVPSGLVLPIKMSLSLVNDLKGWCETDDAEIKSISTQEDLLTSIVFIRRIAKGIESREVIASDQNTFGIYGTGPCEEPNIKLQISPTGELKDIHVVE